MAVDYQQHNRHRAFNDAATTQDYKDYFFIRVEENQPEKVASFIAEKPEAGSWRNDDGLTGLMIAAQNGFREVTALLLFHARTNVDDTNGKGSTALVYAAFAGKATVADLLLKAGANVNNANNNGDTALMSAAAYGHKNTVAVLLAAGADPRLKAKDGETAISYARENGNDEITEALEQRARELDARDAALQAAATNAGDGMETGAETEAAMEAAPAPEPERAEAASKPNTALLDLKSRMAKANLF